MPDHNLPDSSPPSPEAPASRTMLFRDDHIATPPALHIPQTDVILRHGDAELARVTVPPGDYVIGRGYEAEIRVDTPLLSRRHARLTVNFDHALIEDLGSHSGTFVAGLSITECTRLFPNQDIRLGEVQLEIRRRRVTVSPQSSLRPAQAAIRHFVPDELLAEKRYLIGSIVARGGMGAILEAQQSAMKRRVAMKVMLDGDDAPSVARFVDEAQITGQLEHPNIVPVYELGVDENDQLFYTMKFVRGVTLHKVLASLARRLPEAITKYPLPALLTIFQKACDAIAFAHSKGVIHRDLKPENLMLGDFGEVLVMDWGLAKVIGSREPASGSERHNIIASARREEPDISSTLRGSVIGTPEYMAPEQALGEIDAMDQRADIYSLGAILFHILALRPSVSGADPIAMVEKVAVGDIEPLKAASKARPIPKSLAVVCHKAMALAPAARYQSVPELQAEIEAFQNGFATTAENAGALRQLTLLIKRHQTVAALLFAMLILSIVFVVKVIASERVALAAKRKAERATLEAERAAALVSDAHDESAKLLGTLMGSLTDKVAPEILRSSKALVFRRLDEAESGGSDPAAIHGRSVALDTKGFIQQEAGDLPGALDYYRKALALRESAVKSARSDLALHDLAVSWDNLGDVQAATAKSGDALQSYQRSLELSRELLGRDPQNPRWQNDLAVSEGKVAAIHFDQNEYEPAKSHYKAGLKLADALVSHDRFFAKWQALRSFFLGGLGRTALRTGKLGAARRYLTEARASLLELRSRQSLSEEQSRWVEDFEQDLAALPPP